MSYPTRRTEMDRTLIPALLLTLILSACASPKLQAIPDTMAGKPLLSEQTPSQSPGTTALPRDEFEGINVKATYSLTVKNADVRDTLFLLSKQADITIVPDKDLVGRVTIDMKDKSLREILTAILKPLGYAAHAEDSSIWVGKPTLISRTFSLNYIKDKRSSTSTMNASISESGTAVQSTTGIATGSTSGGSSQGNVSVKTSGTSDYWSEIIKGLEVIIFGDSGSAKSQEGGYSRGDKNGKQLVVNELAGIIYVRDLSDNMENIRGFLDDVDRSIKRQVLIQAHIAEVSLNDTYALGIDWSRLAVSGSTSAVFSQSLVPAVPSKVFQISMTSNRVTALLDAMKEQGQLNVLSSPKISTLNNQRAVIKLTTKEVSWISSATMNAQGFSQSQTYPEIDEVGIFLDVTPQITDTGVITMQIHPSISEVKSLSVSPDGKGSKPVIDVREVDTMIQVKNGETIVIAGLIIDKINETKRSVPLLGDIPYLGKLFTFVSQEKKKIELVIFITPYVLNDKTVVEIRKEHEQRFQKSGRKFDETP